MNAYEEIKVREIAREEAKKENAGLGVIFGFFAILIGWLILTHGVDFKWDGEWYTFLGSYRAEQKEAK